MNERFSDRARHALALANLEAGKLRHTYLAPGHIMLGLIAEGKSVATETLRLFDVDLEKVRSQVRSEMGEGEAASGRIGARTQTQETKEVIARAIDEARKFGHRYVGTEHITLGLLAQEDSLPSRILRAQGVRIDSLREKTLAALRSEIDPSHDLVHSRHGHFEWMHQAELAKAFRSPKFWHTLILAVDSANRLGAGEIEPIHLLLALIRDEGTTVATLLREKGVTPDWVRERLLASNGAE